MTEANRQQREWMRALRRASPEGSWTDEGLKETGQSNSLAKGGNVKKMLKMIQYKNINVKKGIKNWSEQPD